MVGSTRERYVYTMIHYRSRGTDSKKKTTIFTYDYVKSSRAWATLVRGARHRVLPVGLDFESSALLHHVVVRSNC